ncbi:hypothetical protein X841_01930 [Streptococcus thermophilus M17PTZA496]|uniref:Uncharacterized protein n=1 Tax=Streptococcus thermophilus M17PTZA496 TaxID=1433289 RepID=A0A0E2Q3V6_STRTR|nr:hypothetical protein X841_01930 [Streptococcus thermophilus M17PTZA496]
MIWKLSKLWDKLLIREIQFLSKALEERLDPMKMDRVSNWAKSMPSTFLVLLQSS